MQETQTIKRGKYVKFPVHFPSPTWVTKVIGQYLYYNNYPMKAARLKIVEDLFDKDKQRTFGEIRRKPFTNEQDEKYDLIVIIDWFDKYHQSKWIKKRILHKKSNFESDSYFKRLSFITNYLNQAKDYEDKLKFLTTYAIREDKKRLVYPESLLNKLDNTENWDFEIDQWFPKVSNNQMQLIKNSKVDWSKYSKVTEEDAKRFPQLKELFLYRKQLGDKIGINLTEGKRKEFKRDFINKYGGSTYKSIELAYRSVTDNLLLLRESLMENRVESDKQSIKNNSNDYALLLDNIDKFSFEDSLHISTLFDVYSELKNTYGSQAGNGIFIVLMEFEERIKHIRFTELHKRIIDLKMAGYTNLDIAEQLTLENGEEMEARTVKRIIETKISKQIARGIITETNTKKCTKCGEEKLATRDNFSPEKGMKDGLRSACKSCMSKLNRKK